MARDSRGLLSVGIDVGTTTTQLVFSRLVVQDVARLGQVPRLAVSAKSVLYESPIHFTPLASPTLVDVETLTALVQQEYRSAGFEPGEIETGAVIVTGEIARAENADAILDAISHLAGDFVVTVAGPSVEAQIAGRGAGVAAYSVEHYTQVTNVDIGGGTANAAIFRVGDHISSSTLAVGGRQLVVERTSGVVRHIAPSGRTIVEALDLPIRIGERVTLAALTAFCDCMAELTADLLEGHESDLGRRIQLTPPLQGTAQSTVAFFSGGVGTYYYDPIEIQSLSDALVHDDVGPLFAQSLRMNSRIRKMNIKKPAQTLRATVMGASSQTVTLSGSTIWVARAYLPLRDLPVVRAGTAEQAVAQGSPEQIAAALQSAGQRWDAGEETTNIALTLDLPDRLDHPTLIAVAEGVAQYADRRNGDRPLVMVLERDYAQALGQTLHGLRPNLPLVVIDQVGLGEGDFIDIGLPLLGGRVVPLSVKTLIFYHD